MMRARGLHGWSLTATIAALTLSFLFAGQPFRRRNPAPLFGSQILALFFTHGRGDWVASAIVAHRLWVNQQVEVGGVGLLGYLAMLVTLGHRLMHRLCDSGIGRDTHLDAAVAILWRLMVYSFARSPYGLPSVIVYFRAIVGLALAPRDRIS